jgi:hypothetical protein
MVRFEEADGSGVYYYDASEMAKHLHIKDNTGKILGRNKFLQMLRYNGMLLKHSNEPTGTMITLGIMRYHFTVKRYKNYGFPLFSDKAIGYIQNRLADGRFQVQFLKKKMKYEVNISDVC